MLAVIDDFHVRLHVGYKHTGTKGMFRYVLPSSFHMIEDEKTTNIPSSIAIQFLQHT